MSRRFSPEYELPKLKKTVHRKAETGQPKQIRLEKLDVSLPSQAGNLAVQRLHGCLYSHAFGQEREMLEAKTAGQGGAGEGGQIKASQPEKQTGGRGAKPVGSGPGRIRHARETPYDVSGPTLDALTGQLHPAGGYPAETNAPIGMGARMRPERLPDGSFRAEIPWRIEGAAVLLPRWTDYPQACPAAQREWDRFMAQTRAHEQAAHVDAALDFIANLGSADRVITGATLEELQQNLEAKQTDLAGRLQAIHDACTHGAEIDAILHPENGHCEP